MTVLAPPPLAPPLFQAVSAGAATDPAKLVPPTPVTYGCTAGSSTWRRQGFEGSSYAPLSPEAAYMVCPLTAMRWKIWFSTDINEDPPFTTMTLATCSGYPHEVLTT